MVYWDQEFICETHLDVCELFFANIHLQQPPSESSPDYESALLSSPLAYHIRLKYGDLASFKSSFSAAANGMFSSGYVWFVADANGEIGVIATYGAGTILVSGQKQRFQQGVELGGGYQTGSTLKDDHANPSPLLSGASSSSPITGMPLSSPPFHPSSQSRALHTTFSREMRRNPIQANSIFDNHQAGVGNALGTSETTPRVKFASLGETLTPLFCVSVHEHAWMSSGYGVWGKTQYLANFWSALNWDKVLQAYHNVVPEHMKGSAVMEKDADLRRLGRRHQPSSREFAEESYQ
jgi:superoxide dismutase, Fe-Mn family